MLEPRLAGFEIVSKRVRERREDALRNSKNVFCPLENEPTFVGAVTLIPMRCSEGRCATGDRMSCRLSSKPMKPGDHR
jgi:hypothetical protein